MADELQAAAKQGPVGLLNLAEVFGEDLPHEEGFLREVELEWRLLSAHGVRETLARILRKPQEGAGYT